MRSSLGLRLLLAATVSTLVALAATALVLNVLFRAYFETRVRADLETHLLLLTGNIGISATGEIEIASMTDPRYERALSGYYWQVEINDEKPVLSPSFWAAPLELKHPERAGEILFRDLKTNTGEAVTTASWTVTVGEKDSIQTVFLTVAFDRTDLDTSKAGFMNNSMIWLLVLGVFLLAASWLTVRVGLRPLENIREEVKRVTENPDARLSDAYPSEVRPLVNEVNELLDQNAKSLARVRTRAGNLAHGLKTPLTILRGVSRKLTKAGNSELATDLNIEIDNMQHIVERELARSRDSHESRASSTVAPVVDRLSSALQRQPGCEHLHWDIDISKNLIAPFDEFDLTELVGNLLDNALKWTRNKVIVHGAVTNGQAFFSVTDDGPGIPKDQLITVLKRGERLDPSSPGSGLGLAIVRDMAESHGCTFVLNNADTGGLRAYLTWPIDATA